jgi:hypothetical protein
MHLTNEVPQADWSRYLDWVSGNLAGVLGTVEVLSLASGDQTEVTTAPIRGIRYDADADAIDVIIGGPGTEISAAMSHRIERPCRLWVDAEGGLVPSSLLVEQPDDERTLVRLWTEDALGM